MYIAPRRLFLLILREIQRPPKITNRVAIDNDSGVFCRPSEGIALKVKVADGSRLFPLISIVSPNMVLLCFKSMESSPLIWAPVKLVIIPVSILIFKSRLDQIGEG